MKKLAVCAPYVIMFLTVPVPALSAPVSITYTGRIQTAYGLETYFHSGDAVAVQFVLDDSGPDYVLTGGEVAVYDSKITDVLIRFGGYEASASVVDSAQVGNDYTGQSWLSPSQDYFNIMVTPPTLTGTPLDTWEPIQFVLQLADLTGTALASLDLPLEPLDPGKFDSYYSYISLTFQDRETGSINGVTADFSPVPLPGAVWLLSSGLAGLIGLRARKKN